MEVQAGSKFVNAGAVENVEPPVQNSKKVFGGNSGSLITFIVAFIVILQFYNKTGKKKNGLKKNGGDDGTTDEYLGFDDLPALKTWIPIKLIGSIPDLLPFTESLRQAEKWSETYGDIFTGFGAGQQFVVFNSGPLVQTLMKSGDFGHVTKAPIVYDAMKPFVSNGVLVSSGPFWQRQRKTLLKSQSFQSLKAYIGMLNRHAAKFVGELETLFEDGKAHQINGLINTAFLGVISEMVTGANLDRSKEIKRYHHNFTIWKEWVVKRIFFPPLLFKPILMLFPKSREYFKAVEELTDFAKRRVHEKKMERASEAKTVDETESRPKFRSVLDELLDAGVEETQVIDEVNTMMFGGHETGASAVHFLCFALALNPKIQEEARKEVDELFEDPSHFKNGMITYDSVQMNLKYVERCIFETLRLFPPIFLVARKLQTALKIEHEEKTVLLPPGTNILVVPYTIHRREEYYPEPYKFDPDRFLPDEAASRHAYSYIPFSAGPRNCLGLKFAMIEMKIMAAYILRNFELTTTDKFEDIPLLPFTTLTPEKDYTFQLKRRVHTVNK